MEYKRNGDFMIKKINEFEKSDKIENYYLIKSAECKLTTIVLLINT